MSNPGKPDPLYILARTALLDALDALGDQREAIVLVGAQAIYLHTGRAGIPIAEYTTDADIALHPTLLADSPLLVDAMTSAGFKPHNDQIGRWVTTKPGKDKDIEVITDLLVPEALGGGGRRGARLGVHGKTAARKVKGLEAAFSKAFKERSGIVLKGLAFNTEELTDPALINKIAELAPIGHSAFHTFGNQFLGRAFFVLRIPGRRACHHGPLRAHTPIFFVASALVDNHLARTFHQARK